MRSWGKWVTHLSDGRPRLGPTDERRVEGSYARAGHRPDELPACLLAKDLAGCIDREYGLPAITMTNGEMIVAIHVDPYDEFDLARFGAFAIGTVTKAKFDVYVFIAHIASIEWVPEK